MIGVDHIYIIKVSCSSLVSEVYRVFQWQIPDRECFELRISGFDSALVLLI